MWILFLPKYGNKLLVNYQQFIGKNKSCIVYLIVYNIIFINNQCNIMKTQVKVKPDEYGYIPEKYQLWNNNWFILRDLAIAENGVQLKETYHITNRNGKKFFICRKSLLETLDGKDLWEILLVLLMILLY